MGTTVTIVTNEVGFYQAPYLIPGIYQVNAELQGFKKAAREVEVRIADRLEVDLRSPSARPSSRSPSLADTPLLETTNASLGNVVDTRRICSCRRRTVIPTPSSAWPPASPTPGPRASTGPSSPRTSSATRWTGRAATAAT